MKLTTVYWWGCLISLMEMYKVTIFINVLLAFWDRFSKYSCSSLRYSAEYSEPIVELRMKKLDYSTSRKSLGRVKGIFVLFLLFTHCSTVPTACAPAMTPKYSFIRAA